MRPGCVHITMQVSACVLASGDVCVQIACAGRLCVRQLYIDHHAGQSLCAGWSCIHPGCKQRHALHSITWMHDKGGETCWRGTFYVMQGV